MVRICFISDVHNKYKKVILPDADIIVCAGDMTSLGKEHEIRNFLTWYSKLNQYKYKIFIAGNHDFLFERDRIFAKSLIPDNIIYLEDSGIEVMGLKFYGTPVNIIFYNWAFNRSEEKLKQHWEGIPDDTDILVTHNPAYGVLDNCNYDPKRLGSPSLYMEITNRIKPLIHVCGHIHSGHGTKVIENTLFINACILNEDYEVEYNPVLVEIKDKKEFEILQN